MSAGGTTSSSAGGTISSEGPLNRILFLRSFFFFLLCLKTLRVPLSSPVTLAGPPFDPVVSHADRIGESSDAPHLTEGDGGWGQRSELGFSDDGDGSCGAGTGLGVGAGAGAGIRVGVKAGDCTRGMEISGASLLLGWVVGPDRSIFFVFVNTRSRRSWMDLPKINPMTAVRCGLSPDEELRIVLGSKVASTKGFNLDWKSSCSISLIRS